MTGRPLNPATRLFGVVARNAPRVVIIRRGPSKQVLLVTWDTDRHEFRAGQWLKGRIYEERCDLSPSGEKFIYLAASQKPPHYSWTAVSRPPFLTALALWPNLGTWGGGGLFETENSILLNRKGGPGGMPAEFRLPKNLRVKSIGDWAGHGEDEPIRSARMERDGWILADEGTVTEYRQKGPFSWEYVRPQRWRKTRGAFTLERRIIGIGERNGPWYVTEHSLLGVDQAPALELGRSDWADWSSAGELLLGRDGKLCRVRASAGPEPGEIEELIDLSCQRFRPVIPTESALHWSGTSVVGRRIE